MHTSYEPALLILSGYGVFLTKCESFESQDSFDISVFSVYCLSHSWPVLKKCWLGYTEFEAQRMAGVGMKGTLHYSAWLWGGGILSCSTLLVAKRACAPGKGIETNVWEVGRRANHHGR